MHLQLTIKADDGQQRTEMCPAGAPISIGRHPQCVVRLDSDLVSRQHAIVHPSQTTMVVEDVSTNGTIAGDRLLRREAVEVPYGTPIVLGDFTLFFMLPGHDAPMAAPGPSLKPIQVPANPAMTASAPAMPHASNGHAPSHGPRHPGPATQPRSDEH